ncbi:excisionase family DNA-binding protein [Falsiroseomonas sp. HC035]|uniref:excisionase family DNA-binding protein n=1 Tax=Falsiroseomonas sp. HC035 TaxID=3390999 RepID=UPI003D3200FE
MRTHAEKLAFTIQEASDSTGIGRTRIFALIKDGRLDARKFGRRTLITATSLRSLVAALPRSSKNAA